jgi:hypothetical protein
LELVIGNCLKGFAMDKDGKQNEARYVRRKKQLKRERQQVNNISFILMFK